MERVRRSKALSILLTVCMLLGLLPVNMLGRAVEVQAAESSTAEYVKYDVGEWTASSDGKSETRTTTWDFTKNQPNSSTTIAVGDTLKGIVINEGTVAYKGLSSSKAPQGFSLGQNTSVTIPLDSATTSVTLEFQLTSNTKTRYITIGNDSKSETVSHNASATEGAHIDSNKIFSGTYDSEFFTGTALKLTAYDTDTVKNGDSKFGYIKITETRAKSGGEGGGSGVGDTELVDFSDTYNFTDESIVKKDMDGKETVTSANKKLTVAAGNSNTYAYNGPQHGVKFGAGNTITIKVKKGTGTVQIGDCQYSKAGAIDVSLGGTSIGTLTPASKGCYHNDTTNNVLAIT